MLAVVASPAALIRTEFLGPTKQVHARVGLGLETYLTFHKYVITKYKTSEKQTSNPVLTLFQPLNTETVNTFQTLSDVYVVSLFFNPHLLLHSNNTSHVYIYALFSTMLDCCELLA